eukprot:m.72317 g.72317  ORF g.72317 m.72317 type:complete len:57 (+) comp13852_c1_seq2:3976-4146(+)
MGLVGDTFNCQSCLSQNRVSLRIHRDVDGLFLEREVHCLYERISVLCSQVAGPVRG